MYHFTVCIFLSTISNFSTDYTDTHLTNRVEYQYHFVILQRARSEEHAITILKKKFPALFSSKATYDALRNTSPSEWLNRHGGKFYTGRVIVDQVFEDGYKITSCSRTTSHPQEFKNTKI